MSNKKESRGACRLSPSLYYQLNARMDIYVKLFKKYMNIR